MKDKEQSIKVLLDEGTQAPVALPFLNRSHEVIHHSDVLDPGAKDELVCATAILNKAILIAIDKDTKRIVKRFGAPDQDNKFARLNLIHICCNEVLVAKRIEHAMSFIENEWTVACEKVARRMWLDIGPHFLRSYR